MTLGATPSQTVGPYFKIGLARLSSNNLASADTSGERITIQGRVLDSNGEPVPDAVIEIWQADAAGKYRTSSDSHINDGFTGFGRIPTDDAGAFHFTTIRPGGVVEPDGARQAPHINVAVFMRGLLRHLVTRIYFDGNSANEHDPVLSLVPAERRHTLYAKPGSPDGSTLHWNVVLQGEQETVFFDW